MLAKIVLLFLAVIAVLGIFGKLRLPGVGKLGRLSKPCPRCGRHRIGRGPCPCGHGKV
ncbi:hypothetical protein ACFSDD_05800 [Salipiger marinus]|jgi:hypothetical protein|uniref:hypothetical protein n=1 Tax=Salipiger marinus TaxID=555512 RepID=UPI001E5A75CE|nr:hypothetical protein [Salipiger manganoxidans]MCD1618336.1 hypothetical protein [Salipiger manganoxidans]MEB3418067.1 hypothetical protein [Salipiger manganoxidans]|tara:strand:- start:1399 stop:1572 length:174 start_codon:yes stop_codon:yes gene_type:complete